MSNPGTPKHLVSFLLPHPPSSPRSFYASRSQSFCVMKRAEWWKNNPAGIEPGTSLLRGVHSTAVLWIGKMLRQNKVFFNLGVMSCFWASLLSVSVWRWTDDARCLRDACDDSSLGATTLDMLACWSNKSFEKSPRENRVMEPSPACGACSMLTGFDSRKFQMFLSYWV